MRGTPLLRHLPILLVFPFFASLLGGCTAMSLANRGAPPEEMKVFQIETPPVDLDEFTHSPGEHDHAAMAPDEEATAHDHAAMVHDHSAPDHDIEEHIAFLEAQLAASEGSSMAEEPSMAEAHHGVIPTPFATVFPESGWVHGFDFDAVDSEGRVLPAEVVHHLQLLVPNRRELFHPIMLRLVAAGGETQPTSVPSEVGVRVEAGDSLVLTAMLHNPTGGPLGEVRLRVRIQYSPEARTWRAPANVVAFFTHVTPLLEDTSYDLPPGHSEKSIEVSPAVSGTVVGMGGHLHRYGVSLRIQDVTSGNVLWETEARRLSDGTVIEVPDEVLVWRGSFDLVAGRSYRVTAVYHNPTGQTIPDGAMGTIGGVFRPDGEWPTVDRNDPAYLWDVERMLK